MSTLVVGLAVLGFFLNLNGFGHGLKGKEKEVGNALPSRRVLKGKEKELGNALPSMDGLKGKKEEFGNALPIMTVRKKGSSNNVQPGVRAAIASARCGVGSSPKLVIKKGLQATKIAREVQEMYSKEDLQPPFPTGFGVFFDDNGNANNFSYMIHDKTDVKFGRGFFSRRGHTSFSAHFRDILRLNQITEIANCKTVADLWNYCFNIDDSGSGHNGIDLNEVAQCISSSNVVFTDKRCATEYLYMLTDATEVLTTGYSAPRGFPSQGKRFATSVIVFNQKPYDTLFPKATQDDLNKSLVQFKSSGNFAGVKADTVILEDMILSKILPSVFPSGSNPTFFSRSCVLTGQDSSFYIVEVPKTTDAFVDALNSIYGQLPGSDNITGKNTNTRGNISHTTVNNTFMDSAVIRTGVAYTRGTIIFVFPTDLILPNAEALARIRIF